MLPRCDMFKEIIFTPRIIAFNDSFFSVGKKLSKRIACLWHEAISGRKQDDIISTFYAFLCHLEVRDYQGVTIWLDNCAAQNKNWVLFSFLTYFINSGGTKLQTLDTKYFETGHTFMSADAFHHQVESQLRRAKNVYDFQDFIGCVEKNIYKHCVRLGLRAHGIILVNTFTTFYIEPYIASVYN
ncbi:unnamed protein product [Brassicogethes aeneus]|uniref:DUF7869 domain-containing protein n=1 Tax=Brassicogethes aeneus TaxID=1431903 RepID=A0A9P0BD67_BRAAE|nr:unnamed protein product [Brassicogethes aeneus]